MSECSHACGGKCCRGFVMLKPPAELAVVFRNAAARITAGEERSEDWDTVLIAEMLIDTGDGTDESPTYTCAHLDDASGLCTIYERRPAMCRDYPYRGAPCGFCGFTNPADALEAANLDEGKT